MKNRLFLFILILVTPTFAKEATFPVTTYAFNTPFHQTEGTFAVNLPDGWRHTEHNDTHYLIAGSDVYGSVSLAYHEMGVMNFTSQFGTPNPPSSEIGGITVYHQVKDGAAAFLRKLGDGWSLRASLSPYPAFQGKDITAYADAMTEFIASATIQLPTQDTVAAASGAISMEFEGENLVFKSSEEAWSFEDGLLIHASGARFSPESIIDNEGFSYMNVFEQKTGVKPDVWAKFSFPQVLGQVNGGKTYAFAKMRSTNKGELYLLLTGEVEADESLQEDLIAFLQSRVQ